MQSLTEWFWNPGYRLWWNGRLRCWVAPDGRVISSAGQPVQFTMHCDVDEEGEAALQRGETLHLRAQAVRVTEPPPITPQDKVFFENAALVAHKGLLDRRVQESVDAIVERMTEDEAEQAEADERFAREGWAWTTKS